MQLLIGFEAIHNLKVQLISGVNTFHSSTRDCTQINACIQSSGRSTGCFGKDFLWLSPSLLPLTDNNHLLSCMWLKQDFFSVSVFLKLSGNSAAFLPV
jgi:hypothetical protein